MPDSTKARPWLAIDVRRLLAWRRERVPHAECARRLGRSLSACWAQAKRFGGRVFPRAPNLARSEALVLRLHGEGLSAVAIARRLPGRPHVNTVRAWLNARGLRANGLSAAERKARPYGADAATALALRLAGALEVAREAAEVLSEERHAVGEGMLRALGGEVAGG